MIAKLAASTAVLLLLAAAPASAMSCCGAKGGKAGAMCGRGDMAMKDGGMKHGGMKHGSVKGTKAACCCEGMGGRMSRRG
ncbi:hypothetical protein [Methylobacterium sp. Leaf108]|uniref:hypothetical protein n=1 Tax=Methylobacterium sp. Leaf108 TaxID=1736256 RepID=UPI0009EA38C4|nr:hypothetical protein [Methylobacterium sp. Leaf108]